MWTKPENPQHVTTATPVGERRWLARLLDRSRPRRRTAREVSTHHRRIYILPTKAGLGYGAVLFATLLGALNYQNNLGLFLTFLMISIALVSMHHCWFQLLGLSVTARDGLPVFAGETAHFPILIREVKDKQRPEIALPDHEPFSLAPAEQATVEIGRHTRRRGSIALDRVVLETTYPFGLFRAWTLLHPFAEALVYPHPAHRAPPPRMQPHFDQRGLGELGVGAEDFVGPRAYRAGDSPRQLDWKALARGRGLVIKQFGGDQSAQAWIDWEALPGLEPERRLSVLTRQVLDADGFNYSYGLRLPDVAIEPGRGGIHKHRCLAALARFEPSAPAVRPPTATA
jgi:uncharacterized protein (DUF58 family)